MTSLLWYTSVGLGKQWRKSEIYTQSRYNLKATIKNRIKEHWDTTASASKSAKQQVHRKSQMNKSPHERMSQNILLSSCKDGILYLWYSRFKKPLNKHLFGEKRTFENEKDTDVIYTRCNPYQTTHKIFKAPRSTAQKNTSTQEKKKNCRCSKYYYHLLSGIHNKRFCHSKIIG